MWAKSRLHEERFRCAAPGRSLDIATQTLSPFILTETLVDDLAGAFRSPADSFVRSCRSKSGRSTVAAAELNAKLLLSVAPQLELVPMKPP